ncbi:MAG TPA: malto-oligosyltrehalose synthase [Thermomicrobiales bacterium]|nr:malto-oligosyltrehalose synthase [Thermomicrobiales bacterium]
MAGLTRRDRALATRILQTPSPAPRATYRLQLHAEFPFAAAREIVPYLARLGVSHLYASPVWASTSGSMHGYDVVDFNRIDEELGGRAGFDALVAALDAHGMSLVLDFVPNHMGIGGGANPWWQDVLENGRASEFASYFDIDWLPLKRELRDQVLVPILGDQFGRVLECGELRLAFGDGAFRVDYYETPFPIAPPTYPLLLRRMLVAVQDAYQPNDIALLELESIIAAFERLVPNEETDPEKLADRRREQLLGKHRLAVLIAAEAPMRDALARVLERVNGFAGDAASYDELEALLDAQSYRLAFWRVAAEEINYRRFFAINELAAIRQEVPIVFETTSQLLLSLIGEGSVTGVRIDHLDGLWNPAGYLHALQKAAFLAQVRTTIESRRSKPLDESTWKEWQAELDELWQNRLVIDPLYLVVEKILEAGEQLPADWPVAGTVGYEFARIVTGLFVQPGNRRIFDEIYARIAGDRTSVDDLIYAMKMRIMQVALVSEVNVLARALDRLTEQNRRTRDYTLNNLRDALREIIACFPIYRTYLTAGGEPVDPRERRSIDQAVDQALRRNPGSDPGVFEFIREVLQLRIPEDASDEEGAAISRFVMKFQQLTGPVMAKGVEDTAFYRYNRLLSLNEVGSDPAAFGTSVEEFHRDAVARSQRWPNALLASSTHDTKRSEDARTRISALTELPREWRAAVNRWSRLNRRHKSRIQGRAAPDRNDEFHFYQTLVGIWPFDDRAADASLRERVTKYMIKAAREGQTHTSWINPDERYEAALSDFVAALLDPGSDNTFLDDFRGFMPQFMQIGAFSSLSQQLLKLTAPGVPDIYQGTELWDLSLVDPDNRRPVDFEYRDALLDELLVTAPSLELAGELLADLPSGRIKLYLTARALAHRTAHADLYARGDYVSLEVRGPRSGNLVAFRRSWGDQWAIVVVPRLIGELIDRADQAPIGEIWRGTYLVLDESLADERSVNEFTGTRLRPDVHEGERAIAVESLLENFPVALVGNAPKRAVGSRSPKGIR